MSPVTYVTCTLSDIYVACNIYVALKWLTNEVYVALNSYVAFKWLASGKRAMTTAMARAWLALALGLRGCHHHCCH